MYVLPVTLQAHFVCLSVAVAMVHVHTPPPEAEVKARM